MCVCKWANMQMLKIKIVYQTFWCCFGHHKNRTLVNSLRLIKARPFKINANVITSFLETKTKHSDKL